MGMIDSNSAKWSNNPELNEQMEKVLGSPEGYFDTTDEIKASKPPVVTPVDHADQIREIVFAWIREDAPLSIKMTLRKDMIDKLVNRLVRVFE